ncbi:hypothetical protein Tco_1387050 [Tanacetum coccineum]
MTTSKLPSLIGKRSILKGWFNKVSIVMGGIFSLEARDMDTKLLSTPESNNTLARCSSLGIGDGGLSALICIMPFLSTCMEIYRYWLLIASIGWSFVYAVLSQMAHLVLVIIVAVVGVGVTLVVVIIVAVVVVVKSSSVIKLSFVIT